MYFAQVVFLALLGLRPRSVLEITGSRNRLEKLMNLIAACPQSTHDLSRVQLDKENRLPRFNMPLELGIALGKNDPNGIFILEEEDYRLQKSTSDLNGIDPIIHQGSPEKLFNEFRSKIESPFEPNQSVDFYINAFDQVWRNRSTFLAGNDPFSTGGFKSLAYASMNFAVQLKSR